MHIPGTPYPLLTLIELKLNVCHIQNKMSSILGDCPNECPKNKAVIERIGRTKDWVFV
jgi:hypothetical protein